ncbi:MAG: hypothetical protein H6993_01420 [Pseudomonadales bacterium]|nr:hypothetical protein [Pseudomonadales bacterium]MCP5182585.1 hypothetical protein [Pseudomonadales bacterium]
MTAAVICGSRLAAAHDGVAELVVTLRHGNGACTDVSLDHVASTALLAACGVQHPDDLVGHGWEKVRDALAVSWNRYQIDQIQGTSVL